MNEKFKKIKEHIEKELGEISEKGLTRENIDITDKLVDIYKDIEEIEEGSTEMSYKDRYGAKDYRYDRGGSDRRMKDNIGRIVDNYDTYEYGMKRYMHGEGSEERMYEGLDKLMSSIYMFVEAAVDFAETPHEKEIIRKYIRKMQHI